MTMTLLWAAAVLDTVAIVVVYLFFGLPPILHTIRYRTFHRRQYDPDYSPSISLFVPCKGADDDLANDIGAFLLARYEKARLFFLVEDERDAAYPIIRDLIQGRHDVDLIVAGTAASCGQKNHNLLEGIKAAGRKDDVYVFLDSPTTITGPQLRDLVMPLSSPRVTVATGFRWNLLNKKTLGERLHAFMIGLQWALLNCPLFSGTWGGGTAIRRDDFESLGVPEYWARTVVDDMALVRLLQEHKKRSVLVPTCIKETISQITTVKGAILWFARQALYLKFYLRFYWLCTLGLLLCISVNFVALPCLLAGSLLYPGSEAPLLAAIAGIFAVCIMTACLLFKRPAEDGHGRLSWFLLSPLHLTLTCCAYLLGAFTCVLHWRNIAYHLDRQGYVRKIVRC